MTDVDIRSLAEHKRFLAHSGMMSRDAMMLDLKVVMVEESCVIR